MNCSVSLWSHMIVVRFVNGECRVNVLNMLQQIGQSNSDSMRKNKLVLVVQEQNVAFNVEDG